MNTTLISFFNAEIPGSSESMDPVVVNALANQLGYIVHPDACTTDVYYFLNKNNINVNSTFYKSFQDVVSLDRRELYIDQCIHYITAAFDAITNHVYDFTWVPEGERIVPEFDSYTMILPITEQSVFERCRGMIYCGMPLSKETRDVVCDFIINNLNKGYEFNVDEIGNKEAQALICAKTGLIPFDKFALLRAVVYSYCEDTMLINSEDFFHNLKRNARIRDVRSIRSDVISKYKLTLNNLEDCHLIKLSELFNRYKYIFMALRGHVQSRPVINKIRRFAKRYHVPFKEGLWEKIVYTEMDTKDVLERVHELSNYKLVQLIQAIRENKQMISTNDDVYKMYTIRNKKTYTKQISPEELRNKALNLGLWWNWLECTLTQTLVDNLKQKKCVVRYPKYLHLACPVSEKNFVGNIPFGSYYTLTNNNYVSIYWRNEWGTRDFDLSFCNYKGNKIGWNAQYYNDECDVIYSGDMVTAEPEASEVIYMKNLYKESGLFYVNRYNGRPGSKYKLIFGQDNIKDLPKNYMVNPNSIQLETEVISPENMQQMIGAKVDDRLYICQFDLGNIRVSNGDKAMEGIMDRKSKSFLDLKEILDKAGFEEYDPEKHEVIDLDLTDLNKDTLISLFNTI